MGSVKPEGAWQHVNAEIYVFLEQAEGIVGTACQKTEKVCCRAYTTPRRVGWRVPGGWRILLHKGWSIGVGGEKTAGT